MSFTSASKSKGYQDPYTRHALALFTAHGIKSTGKPAGTTAADVGSFSDGTRTYYYSKAAGLYLHSTKNRNAGPGSPGTVNPSGGNGTSDPIIGTPPDQAPGSIPGFGGPASEYPDGYRAGQSGGNKSSNGGQGTGHPPVPTTPPPVVPPKKPVPGVGPKVPSDSLILAANSVQQQNINSLRNSALSNRFAAGRKPLGRSLIGSNT